MKDGIAGFFIWERGLRGPCPVKITADLHRYQLTLPERENKALCAPQPLNNYQHLMSLDQLAALFPLPKGEQ